MSIGEKQENVIQDRLRRNEKTLYTLWNLSAFLTFTAVGIYTLVHEKKLKMPVNIRKLLVTGVLVCGIIITISNITVFINHYYDDKINKHNTNIVDHAFVYIYIILLHTHTYTHTHT